jgi:hypothetical protein
MNLILYEKGYIIGSILEKVTKTGVRIVERVDQILVKVFPKVGTQIKKMEVKYL